MDLNFSNIYSALLSPIRIVFLPSVKIYWLYLLSSVIITALFIVWQKIYVKDFSVGNYLSKILSKEYWFHKSALLDYKYYFFNTVLFSFYYGYFVLSGATVSAFVNKGLVNLFGIVLYEIPFDSAAVIGFYSVLFWLMNDFGRFLAHWLLHKNSFLWEFHRLHHSAEVLNPLTVYRVHPVEAILVNSLGALFSGIVTGIAMFVFPEKITMISFLGVNAGIFIFNLYANLRHSNIAVYFPKWLSYIFLSPAQHQIHHSVDIRLQNKNIGVTFAFWDVFLGTLYIPDRNEAEEITFGLKDAKKEDFDNFFSIYFLPFKRILDKLKK
ncbi:fatty acid hydroxylase family protein [Leptospira fainei serovar Hurstbridge str. BUT 6]|uniref:Fatty acid hydroxylase family protein n=1 Tax=Leptospira fainei serovar Hurstbridge str. BUT 6 TaxID=1193011 RepID=S3VIQ8_9LEPT|nr:sterol desaturase family protein [Leptospira fainei]EPG76360.1 fatty acid hydroxylase family protein [Leptospira fainei serovar Hurstbridge str. BUT 6]